MSDVTESKIVYAGDKQPLAIVKPTGEVVEVEKWEPNLDLKATAVVKPQEAKLVLLLDPMPSTPLMHEIVATLLSRDFLVNVADKTVGDQLALELTFLAKGLDVVGGAQRMLELRKEASDRHLTLDVVIQEQKDAELSRHLAAEEERQKAEAQQQAKEVADKRAADSTSTSNQSSASDEEEMADRVDNSNKKKKLN